MRRAAPLLALLALAGATAPAAAVDRVVRDRQGRPMRFDVRAPGVDLGFYARVLRNALHGDEIRAVRVVIAPPSRVALLCGAPEAGGCYGNDRIVVPAGTGGSVARVLLHEYGHHLDHSRPHGDLPEPNGTPAWWRARKIGPRLERGLVAFDYRLGWSRGIGEIFAEDYAALHLKGGHAIGWLPGPSESVLRAMRRDLTGRPEGPAPRDPEPDPGAVTPTLPDGTPGVLIRKGGTLAPTDRASIPFGLLGPGRRITFRVTLTAVDAQPARARAEVVCDGVTLQASEGGPGTDVAIDLAGVGPASCEASVVGVAGASSYRAELTLRNESASA